MKKQYKLYESVFLNTTLLIIGISERYGSQLTSDELNEFGTMENDYEINWHLNHLRSVISPTQEDLKSRSVKIKNRRRAYLDKLVNDGQYFSEDAMREREPYLHHEYIGRFQDPSGRSMARPGERWSETLMRRSEEAVLVKKIRDEQQRRGVAQSDWVGFDNQELEKMEEEEEEETEEEEEEEEEEEDEQEEEVQEKDKGERDISSNRQEVVVVPSLNLLIVYTKTFVGSADYLQLHANL